MKFFEKIKERLGSWNPLSRDYEFEAELEDHPIPEGDVYRLYYVNYHRIQEYSGCADDNVGVILWYCNPFKMPEGMSREDGFKVLSYLTDFIEKRPDVNPYSLKSVNTLDGVLNLERFGFSRDAEKGENVIDLFTVDGRVLLFKRNRELYQKYFNWYVDDVSREEVEAIYQKCGLEFSDIVWLD